MKSLIGMTLKDAKEHAKRELGVKRMGDARFKMILEEGVKKGDFMVQDGILIDPAQSDPLDFFVEEPEPEVIPPKTKVPHPPVAHIDPRLSSSDLPRAGDMYFYRDRHGSVVQGEILSTVCFADCRNPDGSWQTVALQDLHLKKKGVPKETMLNHLSAYYETNSRLNSERIRLENEIASLETKIEQLKQKEKDNAKKLS